MAIPITIPRLGWNMEEGVFGGWLKRDGEEVQAGEAVFTLETDKATEEVESLDSGILSISPNSPKAGDTVPVGIVIGHLLKPGEAVPLGEAPARAVAQVGQVADLSQATTGLQVGQAADLPHATTSQRLAPRAPISPRARRTAKQLGVEWNHLSGSGRTGRIRERDVLAAAEKPVGEGAAVLRSIIARRMLHSHRHTAPVTLIGTVDAAAMVRQRNEWKAAGDLIPSFTDIILKHAGDALRQHPALNARWQNDRVELQSEINIGLAVDTPSGLLVPVVRDVPSLTLAEIAARTRDLIERARNRQLTADKMRGGTFTVSNLGGFGIDAFTPIINEPECAILGIGRIQKQPAVIDDHIVIREQMTLSLTFDHRIVDGAPAARFLQALSALIELAS